MNRILVTGAAGFIGKALVLKLAEDEDNYIYAIDRNRITGCTKSNIRVKNYMDLKERIIVPDVDVIFHLAAYNGTKFFYEKPFQVIKDNIMPTLNLLDECQSYHQKPLFIYTGTPESTVGATIPTTEEVPFTVEDPKNPRWSYANSKALGEQAVIHNGVLNYVVVRPNNIYGPTQKNHFIDEFISRLKTGECSLYGVTNTRTFLYIDDAVDALIKLWKTPTAHNEIYNLGGEDEIKILEVAKLILDILNIDKEIITHPAPNGSVYRRRPDISRIKKAINWEPTTDLIIGLEKTLEVLWK